MSNLKPRKERDILVEIYSEKGYKPSPSRLKKLTVSPEHFLANSKDSMDMIFGTALELMLFDKDKLHEEFYVCKAKKPTAKKLIIIEKIAKAVHAGAWIDAFKTGREIAEYAPKTKDATILKGLLPFNDYFVEYLELLDYENKDYILTMEQYVMLENEAALIRTDEKTAHWFVKDNDVENHYQHRVNPTFLNVVCNGYLDWVQINHYEKKVQPFDIKRTSMKTPYKAGKEFRWDLQGSFYWNALVQDKKIMDLIIEGYEIQLPIFMGTCKGEVFSLQMTPTDIEVGQEGCTIQMDTISTNSSTIERSYFKKGYEQLLAEYKHRRDNEDWVTIKSDKQQKLGLWE